MALWSSFIGLLSGKHVTKGMDILDRGLDGLKYTGEEQAAVNQKVLDWKLNMLKATGSQSVARRVLAFGITGLWSYLVLLDVHLYIFGYHEQAKHVFSVLTEVVSWPFLAAWSLYFLTNGIRAMTGGKK